MPSLEFNAMPVYAANPLYGGNPVYACDSFSATVMTVVLNCIITLSKFTAEPLARGSWFHSHFDNVMTQLI